VRQLHAGQRVPHIPLSLGGRTGWTLSTDFNGTGIDPNSPALLNGNANQTCGKQIGAPAWWINNWGPPGDVVIYPAGANPNSPMPTGPPFHHPKPIATPGVNRGPSDDMTAPSAPRRSPTGWHPKQGAPGMVTESR
jgi:hypothetical protein